LAEALVHFLAPLGLLARDAAPRVGRPVFLGLGLLGLGGPRGCAKTTRVWAAGAGTSS